MEGKFELQTVQDKFLIFNPILVTTAFEKLPPVINLDSRTIQSFFSANTS